MMKLIKSTIVKLAIFLKEMTWFVPIYTRFSSKDVQFSDKCTGVELLVYHFDSTLEYFWPKLICLTWPIFDCTYKTSANNDLNTTIIKNKSLDVDEFLDARNFPFLLRSIQSYSLYMNDIFTFKSIHLI